MNNDVMNEEAPLRHHLLLYAMIGMICFFIFWACIARLDEIVRGDGAVIPASEIQLIQSLEGGILGELLVREGETVREGQPLLRLHAAEAASELSAARQKSFGLQAAIARLSAEIAEEELTLPEEIVTQAPDIAQAEKNAFEADMRQLGSRLGVLEEQKSQKEQEEIELKRRIAGARKILQLAQQERAMTAPMVEKGAASKMELLQLDRQIAEQQSELDTLELALPRTAAAIREAEERINETLGEFKAQAQQELSAKTLELGTLRESMAALEDRQARTEIKSPMDGVVKDIKITTAGGVVKPGETILEIVPLEDMLVVEGRVRPADIAFIHSGQRAVVRLSAFDFSAYGGLEGKVSDISADALTGERGEKFYRVRVRTEKTTMRKNGEEYPVIPGMQATIDIVTGEKTVMRYLLKPFLAGAQTALRER